MDIFEFEAEAIYVFGNPKLGAKNNNNLSNGLPVYSPSCFREQNHACTRKMHKMLSAGTVAENSQRT